MREISGYREYVGVKRERERERERAWSLFPPMFLISFGYTAAEVLIEFESAVRDFPACICISDISGFWERR